MYIDRTALDGKMEKMAKALKDSDVIKITQFNSVKNQSDICVASSAGDLGEAQSVGVKLPTATITVKGI